MGLVIAYILIIVCACVLGSISGMGGGILIKPAFDFIHQSSVQNITFFSSVAVFTMSFVSIIKQSHDGRKLEWKPAVFLGIGSIIGGILGGKLFLLIAHTAPSKRVLAGIQIGATVIVLVLVLLNSLFDKKNFNLNNRTTYGVSGAVLGATASFLGIGGGPINSALLKNVCGFGIKKANFYSLFIIFLSQLANIISLAFMTHFAGYDLHMLWYIVPAAFVGGLVGAMMTKILSSNTVNIIYNIMIFMTILLNAYNLFNVLR